MKPFFFVSSINIFAFIIKRYPDNDFFKTVAEAEQGLNIRVTAGTWGVSKITLQNRMRGIK